MANIVKDPESDLRMTATADVLTEKPRIISIDIMRGLVMVIMALDHARDFYHADAFLFNPTDLEKTSPVLFLTRFITHFCAPTFVLLAGTSIFLSENRKTKKQLSYFLLTRGLWLILLEVTVIRFSMFFQLYYDVIMFQVIWAIGFSMVLFALVIHLHFKAILAVGLIITFGHDILHAITLPPEHPLVIPWTFIHQFNFIEMFDGTFALVPYPFLPWFGILLLGYCLGAWYRRDIDAGVRKRLLRRTGIIAILLFIALRSFNLYGDPAPWSVQKDAVFTLLSFINVTKYPVSLQYTLLTLGPVLILLSWLENATIRRLNPFLIIGRVPLFYYLIHFYVLHFVALLLYMIRSGKGFKDIDFHFNATFGGLPPGEGYALIWAYVAWIAVVTLLYPLCKWYNTYKSTHRHWWLSYL